MRHAPAHRPVLRIPKLVLLALSHNKPVSVGAEDHGGPTLVRGERFEQFPGMSIPDLYAVVMPGAGSQEIVIRTESGESHAELDVRARLLDQSICPENLCPAFVVDRHAELPVRR